MSSKEFLNDVKVSADLNVLGAITGGSLDTSGTLSTTYSNQIYICQKNSTDQEIPHATTPTNVNFGTNIGTASTHTDVPTYSSGVFTVNSTGLYLITFNVMFASNATGWRGAWVDVEDTWYAHQWVSPNSGGERTGLSGSVVFPLNDNSTFSIKVYQTSTGTLSILGTDTTHHRSAMSCVKLF